MQTVVAVKNCQAFRVLKPRAPSRGLKVTVGVNTISAMPRLTEAELAALRMKYQAAHTAHQSCLRALSEAALSGSVVSEALREQEAKALRELNKIRAELLAALADAEPGASIGNPPPET